MVCHFQPTGNFFSQDTRVAFDDELEFEGENCRAPTTPKEEFERTGKGGGGSLKHNFNETFDRPIFQNVVEVPKVLSVGKPLFDRDGEYINEFRHSDEAVPSMDFIRKHGLGKNSFPHEWVNAFVPRHRRRNIATAEGSEFHI